MHSIVLFVEDYAHEEFLACLLRRLAKEHDVDIGDLVWLNTRKGHGAVIKELRQFLRDLQRGRADSYDLIVVATDANCKGFNHRVKEIMDVTRNVPIPVVCAVPDPHIERWLLLDSAAFKEVFGRGCHAPDQKCERHRYKKALIDAIRDAGVTPSLGGVEFSTDLVDVMDLQRAARVDGSFHRLLDNINEVFSGWKR